MTEQVSNLFVSENGGVWHYKVLTKGRKLIGLDEPARFVRMGSLPEYGRRVNRRCRKCRKAHPGVVNWLGMRWIGTPFPKRVAADIGWFLGVIPYPYPPGGWKGCGCILRLKNVWEAWSK